VRLMIAYRLHFEEANLDAIRLTTGGALGNPRIFDSAFTQRVAADNIRMTEPVEKGGGPVYDMGIYCINAARYLFRSEPSAVLAASATSRDGGFHGVDEMTSVVMRFPNERLASFTCSFGASDVSRYSLIGTKGELVAEPAYDYSIPLKHRLTIGEKTKVKRFPKRDQFAAELIYFSDCILKDKEPEPSGWEGLADVRIVRAIYASVRTSKAVQLSDMPVKKKPTIRQEIHRPGHGKPQVVNAESPSGE
jgi:predicted dehydrogenase